MLLFQEIFMFKLIGMLVGVSIIILAGIAWIDAPQAKKVSAQLHDELNQAIEQVAAQDSIINLPVVEAQKLPATVQSLVEQVTISTEELDINDVTSNTQQDETVNSDSPWHIFWKPFRSLQSAEGFASRLSQQTGIEISVISEKNGLHMASFSYQDEPDKQRILQIIHDKTGLMVQIL